MAYRQIHTHIWKDEWFLDLEPAEKLLFVYLFSNDNTTLAGIYKISLKVIAFETGLDISFIKNCLDKFQDAGKAVYLDGVMWVINLMRYNAATNSPKVKACIIKELNAIPDCELKTRYLTSEIGYRYHIDTLPLNNNNINNSNNITFNEEEENPGKNNFQLYDEEIGPLTPLISDAITTAENDYTVEWVTWGIKVASKNQKRNWAYIAACLENRRKHGIDYKPNGNGKKSAPTEPGLFGAIREYMAEENNGN